MPTHFQIPLWRIGCESWGVVVARATYLGMETSEFKTPTLDDDEGAKLTVGIGGIWLR